MEIPVFVIFKKIPGCPLTSKASFGSANTSRQFRRHLPLAGFPATHPWLLPALVLWCTSIFLQAPASGVLLSYIRLCSLRKGKNSFPGKGRGWKTLIPSWWNPRRGKKPKKSQPYIYYLNSNDFPSQTLGLASQGATIIQHPGLTVLEL